MKFLNIFNYILDYSCIFLFNNYHNFSRPGDFGFWIMGIGSTEDTLFKSMNETSISNNVNSNLLNYSVCISTPPNILSDGIWGKHEIEGSPFRSSFPVFLHQVVLIYVTTRAISFPIKKLGLPKLISQMMVTIYLPSP